MWVRVRVRGRVTLTSFFYCSLTKNTFESSATFALKRQGVLGETNQASAFLRYFYFCFDQRRAIVDLLTIKYFRSYRRSHSAFEGVIC